jgi:hypothetical protein
MSLGAIEGTKTQAGTSMPSCMGMPMPTGPPKTSAMPTKLI